VKNHRFSLFEASPASDDPFCLDPPLHGFHFFLSCGIFDELPFSFHSDFLTPRRGLPFREVFSTPWSHVLVMLASTGRPMDSIRFERLAWVRRRSLPRVDFFSRAGLPVPPLHLFFFCARAPVSYHKGLMVCAVSDEWNFLQTPTSLAFFFLRPNTHRHTFLIALPLKSDPQPLFGPGFALVKRCHRRMFWHSGYKTVQPFFYFFRPWFSKEQDDTLPLMEVNNPFHSR